MTCKIHYFNPGHETAILLGSSSYTPPANVQRMTNELALLPLWYAERDDYVWVDQTDYSIFLSLLPQQIRPLATPITTKEIGKRLPASKNIEAAPWGLSPHSINLFEKLKKDASLNIAIPLWKDEYKYLTGRQTAAKCLEKVRNLLPDLSIPQSPAFCTQTHEIQNYMLQNNAPFVLKTPYSSSGRGLHWINNQELADKDRTWINGAFNKQGTVSIEKGLDKIQDFAMEFYSDGKGALQYKGLSVFGTEEKGFYSGNLLQSQKDLEAMLSGYSGEAQLQRIQDAISQVLQEIYGNIYTGYLGVDMLIYKEKNGNYATHPCIEINMRYTMGMVAIHLFENYISYNATGKFLITFDNQAGEAYRHHLLMSETYPIVIENGKMREGYLSLCPVTKETRYRAYVLVT